MKPPIWRDRLKRYTMLLRSPVIFAGSKVYREVMFEAMGRGEAWVSSYAAGERRRRRDNSLDLFWEPMRPAINVVVQDIAPGRLPRVALTYLSHFAQAGRAVRVIAVKAPAGEHELAFRRALEADFGLPQDAQGRIDILDGASKPVACAREDVFLAADQDGAAMAIEALRLRGLEPDGVICLTDDPQPAHEDIPSAVDRLMQRFDERWRALGVDTEPSSGFPQRSGQGLGYRILKPLPESFTPERVCLFVHYDPHDRIDPHVAHYLAALRACGLQIVLISSSQLNESAIAGLAPILTAVVCRQNAGLDFPGWRLALDLFPQMLEAQELIIANDSVYGPVGDLGGLLDRMAQSPFDVWGVAESFDVQPHIQSWFVCFRQAALRSEVFARYWADVLPLSDKEAVIRGYEVPLRSIFEAGGLRVGAAAPYRGLGGDFGNPTMHTWRRLLDLGAPFVKVLLLRDNPLESDLGGWIQEVSRRGYPAHLILDHLRRVAGRGAAGLQTR